MESFSSFVSVYYIIPDENYWASRCIFYNVAEKSRVRSCQMLCSVSIMYVCAKLRNRLEEELSMSLTEFKHFVDEEMITIMRQMDAPSQIFDYLYLGSEWNASNLDELQRIGYAWQNFSPRVIWSFRTCVIIVVIILLLLNRNYRSTLIAKNVTNALWWCSSEKIMFTYVNETEMSSAVFLNWMMTLTCLSCDCVVTKSSS